METLLYLWGTFVMTLGPELPVVLTESHWFLDREVECWGAVSGSWWLAPWNTALLDLPGTLLLCYSIDSC